MLPLLFAAAISANSTADCKLSLAPGERVIEQRILKVRNGTLKAVSVRNVGGSTWEDSVSRMVVLGSSCKVIFNQRFEDTEQVWFTEGRLGDQPYLFVTAFRRGGSGCGYDHLLLAYGGEMFAEDGVHPLAPMLLTHSNMDGIYIGDLGHGRGPGLVLWSAQWRGLESHYEPHRYQIVSYRWRNGRFVGPNVRTTKRKYDPSDPNAVASRLDLAFRDMTQRKRFGGC